MKDQIDLDAIIYKHFTTASTTMRECITEAIHQALVLASEEANKLLHSAGVNETIRVHVSDKILSVEKLIK